MMLAALLAIVAQVFVYAGMWFIRGGDIVRVLVGMGLFFLPANLAFARLYAAIPPTQAGVLSIASGVTCMTIFTSLMQGRFPSFTTTAGAILALAGGVLAIRG